MMIMMTYETVTIESGAQKDRLAALDGESIDHFVRFVMAARQSSNSTYRLRLPL
jgi:hypothetical protein